MFPGNRFLASNKELVWSIFSWLWEGDQRMARPRVFVSSTNYDLKHIRNDLRDFIELFGFEPVLNETGSITYDYTQPLDESCFHEAKLCDVFILIIGGRYGSQINDSENPVKLKQQKDFFEKYISITRKEYRTAYETGLPIYIFIDKNVHSEYRTYLRNKNNDRVIYAYADNIGIYEFIEEVETQFKNNNICSFERFKDIASWLREQWSGLFYIYLAELRKKESDKKMLDSIFKLEMLSENITQMINEVGKTVLGTNGEYDNILKAQSKKLIGFYAERIVLAIDFNFNRNDVSFCVMPESIPLISKAIFEDLLENEDLKKYLRKHEALIEQKEFINLVSIAARLVGQHLEEIDPRLELKSFPRKTLVIYLEEIKPMLEKYPDFKDEFVEKLSESLKNKLRVVPF